MLFVLLIPMLFSVYLGLGLMLMSSNPTARNMIFWPVILLSNIVPDRPAKQPVEEDINWDAPHMARIKRIEESLKAKCEREADPVYQKMVAEWDRVYEIYTDDVLNQQKEKLLKGVKSANTRHACLNEKPLDTPSISSVNYRK